MSIVLYLCKCDDPFHILGASSLHVECRGCDYIASEIGGEFVTFEQYNRFLDAKIQALHVARTSQFLDLPKDDTYSATRYDREQNWKREQYKIHRDISKVLDQIPRATLRVYQDIRFFGEEGVMATGGDSLGLERAVQSDVVGRLE